MALFIHIPPIIRMPYDIRGHYNNDYICHRGFSHCFVVPTPLLALPDGSLFTSPLGAPILSINWRARQIRWWVVLFIRMSPVIHRTYDTRSQYDIHSRYDIHSQYNNGYVCHKGFSHCFVVPTFSSHATINSASWLPFFFSSGCCFSLLWMR